MSNRMERFFPELTQDSFEEQLPALREKLTLAGTLAVQANEHGIYMASAGADDRAASGYQNAWLRDNAMVAFSKWTSGDAASAMATAQGLTAFLKTQAAKMERIIGKPRRKEEVNERPHIRFNAKELRENPEPWSHAQNDALGESLWLRFLLANQSGYALEAEERELYGLFPAYFEGIEYWRDRDSGAWEEERKVNSSSVGAVMAGLTELEKFVKAGNALAGVKKKALVDLLSKGQRTLDDQLPFESPPQRKTDAALLFLIFPLGVAGDRESRRFIVSLVRARLMGPRGIRRYRGDSYFCQDYDQWFPPEARSGEFREKLGLRDEFLEPGCEAQWCLFDPLLSVIYGAQYQQSGRQEHLELELEHLNRSIGQLDEQGRCPELYFLKQGRYVANKHTPLLWTQANLSMALQYLEQSARRQDR